MLAVASDRDTALQLLESASDLIAGSVLLRTVPVTCVTTRWLSSYARLRSVRHEVAACLLVHEEEPDMADLRQLTLPRA